MPSANENRLDAWIVFGGLALVVSVGVPFVAIPTYQLLDGRVVHGFYWAPPQIVVREAGYGLDRLTPQDLARLEQDPRQRELLEKRRKPIIYQPSPSWLGMPERKVNQPARGRPFPTNKLLHLLVVTITAYVYALKYRGMLSVVPLVTAWMA
ncbi:MAG: hypothetical protein IT423_24560 [Pirellulaceae bacterium]|nr:hypothetical protein [Pirellulaceae bacterium]